MQKEKIYIYCIYFPTSKRSNPYYVGKTTNLKRRMKQHLETGSLVCKTLWKYDDWQVTILHTAKDRDIANRIEIEEIRYFNCVAPNGYNLTRGGDGGAGYHHTEEVKKKISKVNIGNQNSKGKNLGNDNGMKNPKAVLKCRISCLKTRIKKLEQGGAA